MCALAYELLQVGASRFYQKESIFSFVSSFKESSYFNFTCIYFIKFSRIEILLKNKLINKFHAFNFL